MEPSDLIILTPPGVSDPALAIAACRAGAMGTLDLEFPSDPAVAGPALAVWAQGGIGPNTAAACLVAGARGVVLDAQVLLTRESPATDGLRRRLAGCDGSETVVLGERLGEAYRLYLRADSTAAQEL